VIDPSTFLLSTLLPTSQLNNLAFLQQQANNNLKRKLVSVDTLAENLAQKRFKQQQKLVNSSQFLKTQQQQQMQQRHHEDKFNIKNLLGQQPALKRPTTSSRDNTPQRFTPNPVDLASPKQALEKRMKPANTSPPNSASLNKFKMSNNKLVSKPISSPSSSSKESDFNSSNHNNRDEYPISSTNNATNLAQSLPSQLNPLFSQQAAMAALSASLFSQSNQPSHQANTAVSNHGNASNLMSLFNNPQLFMAMAAAASTLNTTMNASLSGKNKPVTLPVAPTSQHIKYPMSNFNNNN